MTQRVPLTEVRDLMAPGRPLPFPVFDGSGRLLLAAGQSIHDAQQLAALLERGACVEMAVANEVRAARAAAAAGGGLAPSARRRTWFDELDRQTWALEDVLRQLGKGLDVAPRLEAFADGYIALIERHLDAALYTCVRQHDRRFALYALTHVLHAATVVLVTTRQMGWPADRERAAVRAALTMNASSLELQARMAEQTDPPTKKQLEQIRAHPHQSAQLLRDSGVTDTEWLAAVEDHHERAGGTGYPRGLAEAGEIARVVRAADVFTAKISPRANRAPMLPQQAARQLFQDEQGGPFAAALIKAVGIYPPGEFVKLKNGETAIVTHRASAGGATAVVSLLAANGKPLAGAPRRDTCTAEHGIASVLQERATLPRVLPEQVYGLLEA